MTTPRAAFVLGPADGGRPVTAEEFAEAEFEGPWRYEREGGALLVMSPEGQRHHDDSRPWRRALNRFWIEHPEVVEDVVQGAWIRVDGGTDRLGDIAVYRVSAHPVPPIPDRVPDLVFEIVSPDRDSRGRDYVIKPREYRRLGVREHVVIDRFRKRVTVFEHAAKGDRKRVLRPGDIYTTPLLPGLEIVLDEVF